jgi:hypothetical protein
MAKRAKAAALDAALMKMFRTLEARPVPQAVSSIADQLSAQAAAPLRKAS